MDQSARPSLSSEETPSEEVFLVESTLAEVRLRDKAGREFILVGVGAIGLDTSDVAGPVIERERPDSVCIDLDAARARILADESQWESLSIREVIKEKLLTALLLNLLLASYQRRFETSYETPSGAMPGTELYEALRVSEELGIPAVLADRDLHITYGRASKDINYLDKFKLLPTVLRNLFIVQKNSDDLPGDMAKGDVLSAYLGELVNVQPALKRTLIEEREVYTAGKIAGSSGTKIVAVVGAGRVRGIESALLAGDTANGADLEQLPQSSAIGKWSKWVIPILLLFGLMYLGWSQGREFVRENLVFWIAANSFFTGLGAIVAGAHILAILTAIIVAPISPLIPAGPGTVAAIVQTAVRPPLVKDFQAFADDVGQLRRWRKNRILRILLVLVLCGLGSIIGTLLGTSRIIWSFLGLS